MWINKDGILYEGDCVLGDREATKEEMESWQAQVEKEANKQFILSQIAELEAQQARPLRELMIDSSNTFAKTKLSDINAQIATLRSGL